MALAHERLLHGDAALDQDVADLRCVVEARLGPHLARDIRQIFQLLGQSARRHRHLETHLRGVRLVGEGVGKKAQRPQMGAHVHVEVGRRAASGAKTREQHAEQRHVRKVVPTQAVGVEI